MGDGPSTSPLVGKALNFDERYEVVKELGSGNFGVTKLVRDREGGELMAAKFLERGDRIDTNVEREILIHRTMTHPNIVKFKGVSLSQADLVILMEYASGGELFSHIQKKGKIPENEARYWAVVSKLENGDTMKLMQEKCIVPVIVSREIIVPHMVDAANSPVKNSFGHYMADVAATLLIGVDTMSEATQTRAQPANVVSTASKM